MSFDNIDYAKLLKIYNKILDYKFFINTKYKVTCQENIIEKYGTNEKMKEIFYKQFSDHDHFNGQYQYYGYICFFKDDDFYIKLDGEDQDPIEIEENIFSSRNVCFECEMNNCCAHQEQKENKFKSEIIMEIQRLIVSPVKENIIEELVIDVDGSKFKLELCCYEIYCINDEGEYKLYHKHKN